ncbi:Grancalcin, partial [Cricetulus griseus]
FGNFSGHIPGMQMQMGQPMPGPSMFSGSYPGYLAYSDSYSPADDSMWTYFTAVAGQDGEVDAEELQRCLTQSGISGTYARYRLSPQTLAAIVKRYSKNGRIFFDDYVACCVKLRALTDFFRRRDHLQQGIVNFMYEDVSILNTL